MKKFSERMVKGLKIAALIFTILFTASFIVPFGCKLLPLSQDGNDLPANYYIRGWRIYEDHCYRPKSSAGIEYFACSAIADDLKGLSPRGACLEGFDWFGLINMDQYQYSR